MSRMNQIMLQTIGLALLAFFLAAQGIAQQPLKGWKGDYEPNASYPFGRMNPSAPPETKQFAFMIGAFDCTDEILNRKTGKWTKMPAIWNARYFLNGYGIQDQYWSPAFSTSNIRIFDAKDKKWKVTFFRMPGYSPSTAVSGEMEGKKLVMRTGTKTNGGSYTFYNISDKGFDWVGESIKDGKASKYWTSTCKRSG
ncbi:MAG: hypothetical protein HKN33_13435 [Pyrinomonadaceae bacterium]|nr:hypothetical protein [Pyrinomonadaceae bacterium]